MGKLPIFQCDICAKEIRYTGWETAPEPVLLKMVVEFKYADVCSPCRTILYKAMTAALEQCRIEKSS